MITAADLEYHNDASSDYRWTETYYLPISLPQERIFGHVYCAVLPVLGSMQNDIRFYGSVTGTEFELLYIDSQNHLPAPERFSRLAGPNGLTVTAVDPPRDYRIDYVGRDDTEIHVDLVGIMHPFDIHDPAENPLAGATESERLASTSMGSGYTGHYDMHCRVTGTVTLRGERYAVDTVDRMNHSWGPRPEMDIPPMNSGWAQFGERLGLRFHMHMDPSKPAGQDQRFAHGYLLQDGEVHAITELEMSTTRLGSVPVAVQLTATDARGERWRLSGTPVAGGPWRAYAPCVCWVGMFRWEHGDEVGYGCFQENRALGIEAGLRGRRFADPIPYLTG